MGWNPPSRGERRKRKLGKWLVVAVVLLAGMVLALQARQRWGVVSLQGGALTVTASGTLVDTGFLHPPSPSQYKVNGSAPPPLRFTSWSPGKLGVGTNDAHNPVYHGLFYVTTQMFPANSYVQVVVYPLTASTAAGQTAETVVAVQTGSTGRTGLINYLVVSELAFNGHQPRFLVGYAHGYIADAATASYGYHRAASFVPTNTLYTVTIQTNGTTTARYWLNQQMVFSASNLKLAIQPPFQVYLEVQADNMRYEAFFKHFAVFTGSVVRLFNLPPQAAVTFQAPGVNVHAVASAAGVARLQMPTPTLQGTGTLTVRAASGSTWTWGTQTLSGGEAVRFNAVPLDLRWMALVPRISLPPIHWPKLHFPKIHLP